MTGSVSFSLTGQTALITGSSRGIGEAIAIAMAEAGARVILSSEDATTCAEAAAKLVAAGADATAIQADMTEPAAPANLVRKITESHGAIDVLVCNAGIAGFHGPMEQAPEEEFDRVMAVNLRSAVRLTNLVCPQMAQRRHGSVILIASLSALRGNTSIGTYALSKAALAQLARNLAVRWGPDNIRANAISPGLIDTAFSSGMKANTEGYERRLMKTPLRRIGTAAEIAGAAVFLASPAGGFVTGHNLVVDGGTLVAD